MTKTYNRNPWFVDTPSSKDVKNYFFNTIKWSGISNNKNVIGIDQYSFEDADNVYVDSNNVLRSRPPIKTYSSTSENIVNAWIFQNAKIFQVVDSQGLYKLHIVNGNFDAYFDCEENILPVQVENKVFFFAKSSFTYYDLTSTDYKENYIESPFGDATKYIYIPKTTINTNSLESENEELNELTTSQIHEYNYSKSNTVDFTKLVGKTVTVNVSDIEYEIQNFQLNDRYKIVRPFISTGSEILKISEVGSFITYENGIIAYTLNGKLFNYLPSIGSIIGEPYFTTDGTTVIVFKEDGIYALSVVATEEGGTMKYETWTKLNIDTGTITEVLDASFETESKWVAAIEVSDSADTVSNKLIVSIDGTPKINTLSITRTSDTPSKITFFSVNGQRAIIALLYSNVVGDENAVYCYIASATDDGTTTQLYNSEVTYRISLDGEEPVEYSVNIPANDCGITVSNYDSPTNALCTIICTFGTNNDYLIKTDLTLDSLTSVGNSSIEYKVIKHQNTGTVDSKFILSNFNKNILSENNLYVYNSDTEEVYDIRELVYKGTPIYNEQYIVNKNGNNVYTSYLTDDAEDRFILSVKDEGNINYILFDTYAELNSLYLSNGNKLYITQNMKDDDGNFMWYLPKINTQSFNGDISNLHVLSTNEIGIFLEDSIWYCTLTDNGYSYIQSKFTLGIKKGSDVITSFDGKYILFATKIGFVQMSYQDFIASTEQSLATLTDYIYDTYYQLFNQPVKIFKYQYWYVLYNVGSKSVLIFDTRTSSWWPWSYNKDISKIYEYDNKIFIICNGKIYDLRPESDNYFDDNEQIIWKITSQKLHLNAINNYKRIVNITINAVDDNTKPFTFGLIIRSYRKSLDEKPSEIMDYEVDIVKTYVKRLNCGKVNFFQYELNSDNVTTNPSPLCITSLTIKYRVGSEVR